MAQKYGYAAIGDDGLRPVVWGLGLTREQAERDALDNEGDWDHVVPITMEQYARIEAGDVDASALLAARAA